MKVTALQITTQACFQLASPPPMHLLPSGSSLMPELRLPRQDPDVLVLIDRFRREFPTPAAAFQVEHRVQFFEEEGEPFSCGSRYPQRVFVVRPCSPCLLFSAVLLTPTVSPGDTRATISVGPICEAPSTARRVARNIITLPLFRETHVTDQPSSPPTLSTTTTTTAAALGSYCSLLVHLVPHLEGRHSPRSELRERFLHGFPLGLADAGLHAGVAHVYEDVGALDFLERGLEGVYQVGRQVLDEPHGVY